MKLAETTIRGETFTFRVLWDCCVAQMEAAEKTDGGRQPYYITSMLMAYLTYESYINFLEDRFAPREWAKQREFFGPKSQSGYRGISGKLKYLCEKIPIEGIKRDRRPMKTISELKKIRDFLSHGPMERYEKTIVHQRGKEPPLFGYGKIDRLVSQASATKAVQDVKEAIIFLHSQAFEHTNDIWFGKDPFDDFIAHADSDSKTKA